MSKVIAIANQKGGVGKTTTANELAACLSNTEKDDKTGEKYKVILIDFDQQRNATSALLRQMDEIEHYNTIIDIFEEKCLISEGIMHCELFDLIPADQELSNVDIKYIKDRDAVYLLADICEVLSQMEYDFIIIDNTPARNLCLNMAYVAADYVIVPSDTSAFSLDGIKELESDISLLRNSRDKASHARIIGFILVKCENTTVKEFALDQLNQIAEELEGDIFVEITRKATKADQVKFIGGSLQEYDKYSNAAVDYRRITKKILEIANKEE